MRRSKGEFDGEAQRDLKGWSSFPCKHLFRIRDDFASVGGTLVDDGATNSNAVCGFLIVTGGYAATIIGDVEDNPYYVPADADDVVIIDGGDGTKAARVGGGADETQIRLRNQADGNMFLLDTAVSDHGALFSSSAAALRIFTLKRSTGVVNIYQTTADTDDIEDNLIYTKSGITGSFAQGSSIPKTANMNGFALMAFSDGSLPNHEQLMADFNQINQTWRKPNRMLPAGWTPKFAFA